MTTPVLYDTPGPIARRRTTIVSIVLGLLLLAAGYFFLYRPLAARGQLSPEKWGPLVDPANTNMPLVWDRLATGLLATLQAAALAILTSLLFGTALALLRMQLRALSHRRFGGLPWIVAFALRGLSAVLNALTRAAIEVGRGLPVLVTIFFAWRLSGITNPMWPLVIGLTIYNGIVIAEIIRSGMDGLPYGQREAADSIGLTPGQAVRLVLLPQAFRVMLPALISQLVVILKDTSLGFIITYEDTLAIAQQIIQVLDNPIQLYAVLGVIFIAVNYALSRLATFVQRRMSARAGGQVIKRPPATAAESGQLPLA
ncbi:amino acid ABC transporter permease [Allorhizocola rhizosphaerae]|uniref:amino acid ABC transporter permease n=1 Tax=Allorhizocola rhizosphaerae TaxID=1872709 RepID=UPI000E3E83D9|nr:amino acid ABC transporter permease [Allorhizocola rhizosphaerae]